MGPEKISTLVDSNVMIDVLGPRGASHDWSAGALTHCRAAGGLVINQVVWSELAPLSDGETALADLCEELGIDRETLPWNAAFSAGRAHLRYRRAGGQRERTLPDFLIGAHAAAAGYRILTRDAAAYRTYFPEVGLICPDTYP